MFITAYNTVVISWAVYVRVAAHSLSTIHKASVVIWASAITVRTVYMSWWH